MQVRILKLSFPIANFKKCNEVSVGFFIMHGFMSLDFKITLHTFKTLLQFLDCFHFCLKKAKQ